MFHGTALLFQNTQKILAQLEDESQPVQLIRESQNQDEFAENSSHTTMTKSETKSKASESGKLISHIQLFSLLKIHRETELQFRNLQTDKST